MAKIPSPGVLAIDHSFKVRGGHLTLRTANTFPPDTPSQTMKAREEGWATARGQRTRPAIVETI